MVPRSLLVDGGYISSDSWQQFYNNNIQQHIIDMTFYLQTFLGWDVLDEQKHVYIYISIIIQKYIFIYTVIHRLGLYAYPGSQQPFRKWWFLLDDAEP